MATARRTPCLYYLYLADPTTTIACDVGPGENHHVEFARIPGRVILSSTVMLLLLVWLKVSVADMHVEGT